MFGRSAKTSNGTVRRKRSNEVTRKCPRCRVQVSASAPRCLGCGNRMFVASDDAPIELELPKRPESEYNLSEIQRRILSAAQEGGSIFVYRLPGPGEGEVKSGTERFFGDDAVTALATLIAPGLVAETGDDRFELTHAGLQLAAALP